MEGRAAAKGGCGEGGCGEGGGGEGRRGDGGGDGGGGKGGGEGGGEGGGREPSLLMWYAAGDGDELAEDGHVAQDGEQHGLADLEHDLIFLLVAGLPWKVGKA